MKLAREVEREHGDKVGLNHIGSVVRNEEEGPLWSSAATGMGDGVPVDPPKSFIQEGLSSSLSKTHGPRCTEPALCMSEASQQFLETGLP